MSSARPTVLIAGGGVAGLEALAHGSPAAGPARPRRGPGSRAGVHLPAVRRGRAVQLRRGRPLRSRRPGLEGRRTPATGRAERRRRAPRRSPTPPPAPKSTSTRWLSPSAPRAPTACRVRSPTAGRRAIATSTRRSWRSTEARSRAWLSPCRLPVTGRCRCMSSRSWPPLTWPTWGTGRKRLTSSRPRKSRWRYLRSWRESASTSRAGSGRRAAAYRCGPGEDGGRRAHAHGRLG